MTFIEWCEQTGRASLRDDFGVKAAWDAATKTERERCANVCEEIALDYDKNGDPRNQFVSVPQDGCDECAAAIRAR